MINSKTTHIIAYVLMSVAFLFSLIYAFMYYGTVDTEVKVYTGNRRVEYVGDVYTEPSSKAVSVHMSDGEIQCESEAVTCDGKDIYILRGGEYRISGEWKKGTLFVQSSDAREVKLYLDNAVIEAPDFPAVCVLKAGKIVISALKDTHNVLSDGEAYRKSSAVDYNIDSAVYSEADMTFNGEGEITVNGRYNDGIKTPGVLKIMSGVIGVFSADDGITGNHSVSVDGGNIKIESGGDGIKSENKSKAKGFVALNGGKISITSQMDAVAAGDNLYLNGECDIKAVSGGGYENAQMKFGEMMFAQQTETEEEEPSAKGLKALGDIYVNGGVFDINAKDDAVHADNNIIFDGGSFYINTGDDAIHANSEVIINNIMLKADNCYEGIEGSEYVEINGGKIDIIANDDGINSGASVMLPPPGDGAGGPPPPPGEGMMAPPQNGGGQMPPGPPPQMGGGQMQPVPPPQMGGGQMPPGPPPGMMIGGEAETYIRINNGEVRIKCGGDGIDSNGTIEFTGGFTVINGPNPGPDSAIDFDGQCFINGGVVLTAGSSGMNERPEEESKQNCIWLNTNTIEPGKMLAIKQADKLLYEFEILMNSNLILVSSDLFRQNEEYDFFIDDELLETVKVDGILTIAGEESGGGMMPSPPPMNGENGQMMPPPQMNGENGQMMPPPQMNGGNGQMMPPQMNGGNGQMMPPQMNGEDGQMMPPPPPPGMEMSAEPVITFDDQRVICLIVMLVAVIALMFYRRRY